MRINKSKNAAPDPQRDKKRDAQCAKHSGIPKNKTREFMCLKEKADIAIGKGKHKDDGEEL